MSFLFSYLEDIPERETHSLLLYADYNLVAEEIIFLYVVDAE